MIEHEASDGGPSDPGPDAKLRVMHVLHGLKRAGAEQLVYELATANRETMATGVIVLDEEGPLADPRRQAGAAIYPTARREGLDWAQRGRIAAALADFRPDVVQCHQYTPFFYTAIARCCRRGPRVLFTEHGRHYPDIVGLKRRWANRLVLARLADRVTAVCEFTKRALVEREGFGAGQIEVVYNGVDPERFAPSMGRREAKRRWDLPEDLPAILQVGTFRAVKDHPTALRAFAGVRRAGADAMLVFAGDGPDRAACERLAEELEIADRTRFLGSIDNVPELLPAGDVMLMTSVSEAHSVSLLEGMASGLAVVATDVGGIPETVEQGVTGLLAQRGDSAGLARAMGELLADPARREAMGEAGRERVQRLFRRDRMHGRYMEIYRELAGRRGRR